MNEQLQQALINLINSTVSAEHFVQSQLPEAVNQLLVWKLWVSVLSTIFGLALLLFGIYLTLHMCKYWDSPKKAGGKAFKDAPVSGSLIIGFDLFALIPALALTFDFDWLQIWLAPKIYLIEYAAHLVKH